MGTWKQDVYFTEGVLNKYTVNVTEKYSIIWMNHRVSINVKANYYYASSITPKISEEYTTE